jgi:hypothetical protein
MSGNTNKIDNALEAANAAVQRTDPKWRPFFNSLFLVVIFAILLNVNIGAIVDKNFDRQKFSLEADVNENKTALQGLIEMANKLHEQNAALIKLQDNTIKLVTEYKHENEQLKKQIMYIEQQKK